MSNNVADLDNIDRIFKAMSESEFGKNNPNHVKRDTEKMSTTSQMFMNLSEKELHFSPIEGKCDLYGVYDFLPEEYTPKIKVFTYDGEKKEY